MYPNETDGESGPTRRQTLRATLLGAAAITTGSGIAAAASDDCDVSEDERAAVRQAYADGQQVYDALEGQTDLRDTLAERGLVGGTTELVQVLAPLDDCEPTPEYRVYHETDDGDHVTVMLRPKMDGSTAVVADPSGPGPDGCGSPLEHCFAGCHISQCCSCQLTSCGPNAPSSYCCWGCLPSGGCRGGGCTLGFTIVEPDPIEVEVDPEMWRQLVG